jgi:hypothetical protein
MGKEPAKSKEELILDAVLAAPLALLHLRDPEDIVRVNALLPASVGMEIECHKGPTYDFAKFKAIPHIMDSPGQWEEYEFRFRVPAGINGFLCLYAISIQCKQMLQLNPGSGIHFHGDMTDFFDLIPGKGYSETAELTAFIDLVSEEVLTELDTWKTGCGYPRKMGVGKGYWFGFRSGHKTGEFRTGDMSFDYDNWSYRAMSVGKVVKIIRNRLAEFKNTGIPQPNVYRTFNPSDWLPYFKGSQFSKRGAIANDLKKALDAREKIVSPPKEEDDDEMRRIIESRKG